MAERAGGVESLGVNTAFWFGKRVLVTGHTGFKGSWLSLWLNRLGAAVAGYALDPPTSPSLFCITHTGSLISDERGDICRLDVLLDCVRRHQPEVVFHLAAQPLVRRSYADPIGTYMCNVMGTANVMEAVRQSACVRVVVSVTSDKVYENREVIWGYRESDALSGHDPYSSSKACAELVSHAYRKSFFEANGNQPVALATARAGNVIGGGDWAEDRLIPDCIRALSEGHCIKVRNPHSVRPWQHVLEPLAGYLLLAERMWGDSALAGAYNFGPENNDTRSVSWVVDVLTKLWGGGAWQAASQEHALHEAAILTLDSTLARTRLGWIPRLALKDALSLTVEWYRAYREGADMNSITLGQIAAYEKYSLANTVASFSVAGPE